MSPLRGLIPVDIICYNHDVPPGLKKKIRLCYNHDIPSGLKKKIRLCYNHDIPTGLKKNAEGMTVL